MAAQRLPRRAMAGRRELYADIVDLPGSSAVGCSWLSRCVEVEQAVVMRRPPLWHDPERTQATGIRPVGRDLKMTIGAPSSSISSPSGTLSNSKNARLHCRCRDIRCRHHRAPIARGQADGCGERIERTSPLPVRFDQPAGFSDQACGLMRALA